MKRILVAALLLSGCASAPAPKAPDESQRVPVNRVAPPEATTDGTPEKAAKKAHKEAGQVEWR